MAFVHCSEHGLTSLAIDCPMLFTVMDSKLKNSEAEQEKDSEKVTEQQEEINTKESRDSTCSPPSDAEADIYKGDHEESSESDETNSDDSLDYSVWDYIPDPSIEKDDPDYFMNQRSQPCHTLRGSSYTPPGWKRKYHRKRKAKQVENKETGQECEAAPGPIKKLKF